MGIALTNLGDDGSVQLELPWDRRDSAALDRTVDAVRERFGAGSLTRAVLLGRPRGVSAPQLPD